MNIDEIEEKRKQIIEYSNTAQTFFSKFLQEKNDNLTELTFTDPLYGDLDLSVLQKFPSLRTIVFLKGSITSIQNIPIGISKFICSNQLLIELKNLPATLLYLDFDNNFLKEFDFISVPNLEILHASNNLLKDLKNISPNIQEIYCRNNKLNVKKLDLTKAKKLHKLMMGEQNLTETPIDEPEPEKENNSWKVISTEILPANYGFEEENLTPEEFEQDIPVEEPENENPRENTPEQKNKKKPDYQEALDLYFKAKTKYETNLQKQRKQEFEKLQNKSKTVVSTKKLWKIVSQKIIPKCLKCKQSGGTNFYTNEDGYFAVCGNAVSPCSLKVKLLRGSFYNHLDYFYELKDDLKENQNEIIKFKLKYIFNYISNDESKNLFQTLIDEYNSNNDIFTSALIFHKSKYDNEEEKKELQEKTKLYYEINKSIKELLDEYQNTMDLQLLNQAMYLYKKDLMPIVENIRNLKYAIMEMNENELFQRKISFSSFEYFYGEKPSVVYFDGI